MKEELISVIITTYKRSDKLEDAIKSVLEQTYKKLEIIVVDDNSEFPEHRKKTIEIVSRYKNVILIKNEKNLGGALSRNVGIDRANGSLISFLDDDDYYLPVRIQEMYECYLQNKNNNVGLIYCNCYSVNDKKEILGSYENNYNGNPLYEQMLGCIAATSMWLVPKKVLVSIGKFEDSPCKQDSIVLLKILIKNYNIYAVNKCLVLYYEHGGTGISGTKISNIKGLLNYRNWCRKYYDKLHSENKVKDVECKFSKQLITLYLINNMRNEAWLELKLMFKKRPFAKSTWLSLFKFLFTKIYIMWLKEKKK